MKNKGKIFLFSRSNNIIVETTVDKIYIKNSNIPTEYYESTDPRETAVSSLQYGKIVYIKEEDFNDMLLGNRRDRSWRIFKVISLGHKDDNFTKLKVKISRFFSKKKGK